MPPIKTNIKFLKQINVLISHAQISKDHQENLKQ